MKAQARSVRITILADNTAKAPYVEEHGFSAFVEIENAEGTYRILFDTGRGALFGNAPVAGVNPFEADAVVLSHGHYDHTDALAQFLERQRKAGYPAPVVFASRHVFSPHFSTRTGSCRPIGLSPESRAALESCAAVESLGALDTNAESWKPDSGGFVPVDDFLQIAGGCAFLGGAIPRREPLEVPSPLLFLDDACTIPDSMIDELFLAVRTATGLFVLTGCCHAGLINTLEHATALSNGERIAVVAGGLHLAGASAERLEATADYLVRSGIARAKTGHCTGKDEESTLAALTGGIVRSFECGSTLLL